MSVTELDSLITKQQFKRCLLLERKAMTNLLCLITQPYPTLCNPMHCSPPGSSVHWDSPGKNTGVGCHTLLQGIFPTQGSNPGLPHCWWILYHLSHQGSPQGIIFKSRDITLPTKVCIVKAMFFPVVMYRCENQTIKKIELQGNDAFKQTKLFLMHSF